MRKFYEELTILAKSRSHRLAVAVPVAASLSRRSCSILAVAVPVAVAVAVPGLVDLVEDVLPKNLKIPTHNHQTREQPPPPKQITTIPFEALNEEFC